MKTFIVEGEHSVIPLMRFRLECKREKVPGRIVEGENTWDIDENGRFVRGDVAEWPSCEEAYDKLLIELLS